MSDIKNHDIATIRSLLEECSAKITAVTSYDLTEFLPDNMALRYSNLMTKYPITQLDGLK